LQLIQKPVCVSPEFVKHYALIAWGVSGLLLGGRLCTYNV
jgi:hypothetical protein